MNKDVQRIVEVHALEADRCGRPAEFLEALGVAEPAERRSGAQVTDDGRTFDTRQVPDEFAKRRQGLEFLAGIGVAVGTEDDLRGDLSEALLQCADAQIRRAGGPDRTARGGREHGDAGLGNIRQHGSNAVAAAYTTCVQPGTDSGHRSVQLAE